MKPREISESGEQDLFRSRLDQIIDMQHQLVKLAQRVNWKRLETVCGDAYRDGPACRLCRPD
jgi:transposase, IS5 family